METKENIIGILYGLEKTYQSNEAVKKEFERDIAMGIKVVRTKWKILMLNKEQKVNLKLIREYENEMNK